MTKMTTYKNPIIAGFHPDPSICRVGEDYYLATSSFEYFPGVPIYHSRDLVNWRQIGHCLTRRSQLDIIEGYPNCLGIYAPTLRYNKGNFYMVTTNQALGRERSGNFFVTAKEPKGPWSEPVFVDAPGIDPDLFFDDDGKVYYTGADGGIFQFEIDIKTGKRLSAIKRLWSGMGYRDPEAPHVYKIGGKYYLIIAEGGTSYGHMISIARGNNPCGPHESCPYNPILTHRSTNSPIQAVGHGDMIEAHDGSWWMVCLGIRPVSYPDRHHLGRETFLTSVEWTKDGWPIVKPLELEVKAKCLPLRSFDKKGQPDDVFGGDVLGSEWSYIRNPIESNFILGKKKGALTLIGTEQNLNGLGSPTFVGRRLQYFDSETNVRLDFEPLIDGEEAGITTFLGGAHVGEPERGYHYEIAVTRIKGKKCIIFRRWIGTLYKVEKCVPVEKGMVTLYLTTNPREFIFGYRADNAKKTTELGRGEAHLLSTEAGGTFTGLMIGLYATGNGKKCETEAHFDSFNYIGKE